MFKNSKFILWNYTIYKTFTFENSNFKNVMWLDADGSMGGNAILKMINEIKQNPDNVIIGSRFVSGGGYKGQNENGSENLFRIIKNIINSEDSILAVYLSKLFNNFITY